MGDKILSSAATGYVILSKLHDSTYKFNVGFPDNKWPEQSFTVVIDRKDHGFLLRNFEGKGWGLFDLQDMSVQMSSKGTAKVDLPKDPALLDNSVFTDILSKAADDPTLKEKKAVAIVEKKAEPKKEEPKKAEEIITAKTDPVINEEIKKEEPKKAEPVARIEPEKVANVEIVKTNPGVTAEVKTEEIKKEEPKKEETVVAIPEEEFRRSTVTKRSESSTTAGFGLVYTDDNGGGEVDTIRIFIPEPKPVVMPVKEEPKEEIQKKFLDVPSTDSVKAEPVKEVTKPEVKEEIKAEVKNDPPVVTKSVNKCAAVAEESDFFRLRKNMAGKIDNEGMIGEAKKYFKLKCFTTKQIRNLSSMFLDDDAAKYKFFDAAYEAVSDIENFPSLKEEMKDTYYVNRFLAMLR